MVKKLETACWDQRKEVVILHLFGKMLLNLALTICSLFLIQPQTLNKRIDLIKF